jgi:hypothetical protein
MNMKHYKDSIVAEVRKSREELLEAHGGIEGYLKYLQSKNTRWEAEGFKSVASEEIHARKHSKEIHIKEFSNQD